MNNLEWKKEIGQALLALQRGSVILYPTDTIWGLGCDPRNAQAVARIFEIKQRPKHKGMILLADKFLTFAPYVRTVPESIHELIDSSTKPLTVIYPGAQDIAAALIAEDGSIGVRVTKDPFCMALIAALGRPLVSTSANLTQQPFGGSFADIASEIKDNVDHVVSWRQNEKNNSPPSRIVRLDQDGEINVLRA